jgi:Zn ribbon nucleic-acid-binding protein
MTKPAMTNDEYIQEGGTVCPFCKSYDIQGQEVNIDAGSAWQDVSCNKCGHEWQDTYTLTGYANK